MVLQIMTVEYGVEKAQVVLEKHGIDLEEVKQIIEAGRFTKIKPNPNYPHQVMLLIQYQGYPCCVPCVHTEDGYFIKTAYYNRDYKTLPF